MSWPTFAIKQVVGTETLLIEPVDVEGQTPGAEQGAKHREFINLRHHFARRILPLVVHYEQKSIGKSSRHRGGRARRSGAKHNRERKAKGSQKGFHRRGGFRSADRPAI